MERIRADTPDLKEAIHGNYEAIAPRYDWVLGAPEYIGLREVRRRLLRHARGLVLEVAVGTGRNLEFYPPGCQVHAIDFSRAMLLRAAARADRLGLAVDFQEMDAEHLDYPDDAFDTVVCTLATFTFPDPRRALREMGRVARPDGRVLLLEHGMSDRRWLRKLQELRAERQFQWLGNRWERDPHRIAEAAGLCIEEHRRLALGILNTLVARPDKGAPTAS